MLVPKVDIFQSVFGIDSAASRRQELVRGLPKPLMSILYSRESWQRSLRQMRKKRELAFAAWLPTD